MIGCCEAGSSILQHTEQSPEFGQSTSDLFREHTYSRRWQASASRLVALGEIVAGVAHNFGNVLMGVSATLELLQMKLAPHTELDELRELVAGALDRVGQGGEMTHRLLSFAKHPEPIITGVDLRSVANNALALCATHPLARRVGLVNDIADTFPLARADEGQTEEVLANLVLNALHASENGLIRLDAIEDRANDHVVVTVSDEGCGIEPDDLPIVWQPFYSKRRDGSTGTGMGLPCCLSQVMSMGGTIEVESTPGQGSTFSVSLPRWEEEQQ